MTTLKEIENALSQLPEDQLNRFREWFDEFDAESWDKQLEADVKAGRGIVKCCGWQESASGDFRLPLSFHRR